MKNYTLMTSMKTNLVALAIAMVAISACKKDDPQPPKPSYFSYVNLISGSSLDFYVDNKKTPATSAISFGSITSSQQVMEGSHKINYANANTLEGQREFSHNFGGDKTYAIYAYEITAGNRDQLVLEDTLPNPPAGKAWVRYVNFTNASSPIIQSSGPKTEFGVVQSKGKSFYKAYDAGDQSFVVTDVTSGASSDSKLFTFQGGKIYTLALTGAANNYVITAVNTK